MRTLVMIHGFRGTHEGLDLIKDHLPGYAVVVPDLPGFASGKQLASYDLASYVAWLRQFMDEQALSEPPVLLGHSFGSIICAAYAARYAEKIEKLILVNPIGAPALEGPRGILSQLAVFYYWVGTRLPETWARAWLSSQHVVDGISRTMTKSHDPQVRAYIKDQHRRYFSLYHSPASVSASFKTSVTNSVRDFARNINVPTLLIVGDKDDITPLYKQQELAALFPDATLAIIPNVGHLTHYETPGQVAGFIQDFTKLR